MWLWVLLVLLLIGAVGVVATGRWGQLADTHDDRPDVTVPSGRRLAAEDLRDVRLSTGLRGYRMDEVDALLDRLQSELPSRAELSIREIDADQREGLAVDDEVSSDATDADEVRGAPDGSVAAGVAGTDVGSGADARAAEGTRVEATDGATGAFVVDGEGDDSPTGDGTTRSP